MGFKRIDPVNITPPTSSTWLDVDLSAYVSSKAVLGMFRIIYTQGSNFNVGIRCNGSTDAKLANATMYGLNDIYIGMDSNKIIEVYSSAVVSSLNIYLIGYFEDDIAEILTNAIALSPTAGSYVDIDISSYADTSRAVVLYLKNTNSSNEYYCYARPNGSTDDKVSNSKIKYSKHVGVIVGVDNNIFEINRSSNYISVFLQGYIKKDLNINTNGVNISISTLNTWTDLAAFPENSYAGLVEITGINGFYMGGIRENGSSEDAYGIQNGSPTTCVECDESLKIEGRINNAVVDFYLTGYFIEEISSGGRKTKFPATVPVKFPAKMPV